MQLSTGKIHESLRNLSLDIVSGAMAVGYMATRLTDTNPGWAWWVVLACSVWLIYTCDHLIDAWGSSSELQPERHKYHRRHSKALLAAILVVTILTAFLAFTMLPRSIIIFGVALGSIVLVYLLLVVLAGRSDVKWFQKELLVALLYTAGIWGGPVVLSGGLPDPLHYLVPTVLFLLAWADLIIFSIYDLQSDSRTGHSSLPRQFGSKHAAILVNILFLVALALVIFIISGTSDRELIGAASILILMGSMLFTISRFNAFFAKQDRYRIYGEMVFFIPVIMVIFPE